MFWVGTHDIISPKEDRGNMSHAVFCIFLFFCARKTVINEEKHTNELFPNYDYFGDIEPNAEIFGWPNFFRIFREFYEFLLEFFFSLLQDWDLWSE